MNYMNLISYFKASTYEQFGVQIKRGIKERNVFHKIEKANRPSLDVNFAL